MKLRMATVVLCLFGVFVSIYLYLYKIGKIGSLVCGTGGCETVQASPYSRFMGVEVALIGVVGYGLLFGVGLFGLNQAPGDRRWPLALLVLSGIGVGFTVYLTYLELFVIHAICRWCVGSAVLIGSIFVTSLLDWRRQVVPSSPQRGDALAQ